ncbi:hypothetical protein Hsc_0596 [Herbaspirillum seropedicae]|nr:hypothetical protein Hsc_0596 [Herbaspirillum seropedicae]
MECGWEGIAIRNPALYRLATRARQSRGHGRWGARHRRVVLPEKNPPPRKGSGQKPLRQCRAATGVSSEATRGCARWGAASVERALQGCPLEPL